MRFNQTNNKATAALPSRFSAGLALAVALLSIGPASLAADIATEATPDGPIEEFSAAYFSCQDEARGIKTAMQACMGAELQFQQKLMDQALQRLRAQLDSHSLKMLNKAQSNWVAYRDSTCEFYPQVNKSALAHLEVAACQLDVTMERSALLRHWQR